MDAIDILIETYGCRDLEDLKQCFISENRSIRMITEAMEKYHQHKLDEEKVEERCEKVIELVKKAWTPDQPNHEEKTELVYVHDKNGSIMAQDWDEKGLKIGASFHLKPVHQPVREIRDEARAIEILNKLVELKDHKDRYGKTKYYNGVQPRLWREAKTILTKLNRE